MAQLNGNPFEVLGDYELRHLAKHLYSAGLHEELYALIDNEYWMRARRAHEGSHSGFLDDVEATIEALLAKEVVNLPQLFRACLLVTTLADLPRRLGRPQSTLPKLVDEYYWVTITRDCKPPDPHTLERWVAWSR